MNEKEVREQCVKLTEMCFSMRGMCLDLSKDNERLKNQSFEQFEALDTIATLIHYQADIAEQDVWLKTVMDRSIWKPETVQDIKNWLEEREVGACCRNGCEKCEQ